MSSHTHGHHDHDHHNHHHYHGDFSKLNLTFVLAVVANLGFTILEAVFAIITGSASLLADAGHNLSDVLGLLLAWGAAYLATLDPTKDFSYGYRRLSILAALINALVLIFASLYIAYESIEKLINPTPIPEFVIMIVATIGIFVNAGCAWLFHSGSKEDLNLKGAYLHLAYDALISVGVVVAALVIYLTDWIWIDGLVGLFIVAVIVIGTWGLFKESLSLMMDGVPAHIDRAEVSAFLESVEGVSEVHDLHIWAMSTNETCLTAHLVMPENTLWDSEDGYNAIGRALKDKFQIHHITLQVEKDFDCVTQDCD